MSVKKHAIPYVFTDPSNNVANTGDCDCADCACSVSEISDVIGTTYQAVNLVKAPISYVEALDTEYTLFYGPYHQPVILNRAAQDLLNRFESPQALQSVENYDEDVVKKALVKLQEARLLHPVEYIPVLQQKKQLLSAWIHVTDRCNLRCAYCYLPHIHHDMDIDTGKEIIDTIFNEAVLQKYHAVKLKYAGGEPLLQFPLIQQLHQYAYKGAERYHLTLEGVILSNGTLLTQPIAKAMNDLGVNLMISLDGLGRVHDAHRPYAGGRGTFQDVQSGIRIAKKAGLTVTVSVTISDDTAGELPELVRWLLAEELRFNLNFYRKNELSSEKLSFGDQRIIQGMLDAYKEIENNLPNYSLLDAIVDRANLSAPHLKTCGVGQNYMVFDPDGHVSKCQMHLYNGPRNHQTNQPLQWVQTSSEGIQNLSVEEKDGCNSCQWKYWCAGGCPLLTYQTTGRFDTKSPNCLIYKAIYPEAMRLEGLRLIQINKTTAL